MEMNVIYVLILMFNIFLIMLVFIPSEFNGIHPMFLSILLIFYVIIFSFKMNFMMNNYYYSYILFLIMIGGLMILFMYFTSLVNNELIYIPMNYYYSFKLKFMLLFIMMTLMVFYYNNYDMFMFMNYFEINKFYLYMYFFEYEMIKGLMMDYFIELNIFMIMYLFFTMICTVLICCKVMIPLRQIKLFN